MIKQIGKYWIAYWPRIAWYRPKLYKYSNTLDITIAWVFAFGPFRIGKDA